MGGVIFDTKLALDQLCHARIVPHLSPKSKSFRALGEQLHQSPKVCRTQLRWATPSMHSLERFPSSFACSLHPLADRSRAHSHSFGNVALLPPRPVQCPSPFPSFYFPFRFLSWGHSPQSNRTLVNYARISRISIYFTNLSLGAPAAPRGASFKPATSPPNFEPANRGYKLQLRRSHHLSKPRSRTISGINQRHPLDPESLAGQHDRPAESGQPEQYGSNVLSRPDCRYASPVSAILSKQDCFTFLELAAVLAIHSQRTIYCCSSFFSGIYRPGNRAGGRGQKSSAVATILSGE
jgi:hypothetical protein